MSEIQWHQVWYDKSKAHAVWLEHKYTKKRGLSTKNCTKPLKRGSYESILNMKRHSHTFFQKQINEAYKRLPYKLHHTFESINAMNHTRAKANVSYNYPQSIIFHSIVNFEGLKTGVIPIYVSNKCLKFVYSRVNVWYKIRRYAISGVNVPNIGLCTGSFRPFEAFKRV